MLCACLVAQSCPTLRPMDGSLPRFSVHGILQARILVWIAIHCSQGFFLTQGQNPGFLYYGWILHCLSHQGNTICYTGMCIYNIYVCAYIIYKYVYMYWRRKWQPTPVFLPGESQGWQSLVGCCLCTGVCKYNKMYMDVFMTIYIIHIYIYTHI